MGCYRYFWEPESAYGPPVNPVQTYLYNVRLYKIKSYVAMVLPMNFGGELEFKHCKADNDCQKSSLAVFGSGGAAANSDERPINKENFMLRISLFEENSHEVENDKGLQTESPADVQWTHLSVEGESKGASPKLAPPLMVFKIKDRRPRG